MKKYEFIDHTADVCIKAFGNNISESFENAAKGMFDLITDNSYIENIGQYEIYLKSEELELLLVEWLSELLFLNTSRNLVFGFFKVDICESKNSLSAKIFGEKFSLSKHKVGVEIKAVTYHMLEIRKKKPYYVQVLFDI
jgi:SHS2 domain-containing protein